MITKSPAIYLTALMLSALSGCGTQKSLVSTTDIVGGQQVAAHSEFEQSTVAIGQMIPGSNEFGILCSGTLISKRWVLTAGHCLDLKVIGTQQTHIAFGTDIEKLRAKVEIKKVYLHPSFNLPALDFPRPSTSPNDIGLIELKSDAPGKVMPILGKTVAVGKTVILAGWGAASLREADLLDPYWPKLRKVEVKVSRINDAVKEIEYFSGTGKSACVIDSGGPMYVRRDDKSLALAGIISRSGPSNKECDTDGVNTNPVPFLKWILETTKLGSKKQ